MTKIMIDAGHGGRDPGAVGNGLQEKVIVLEIAKKIQTILLNEYEGVQVRMTRDDDSFLELSDRANRANNWGADFFLSIHVNAGGGTGFESFIHTTQASASVNAQNTIHAEIMKQIAPVRDRGKKNANFAVLRLTKMPALLTEVLFIDTVADANLLKQSAFIDKVVRGHVEGLVKQFKLKKKAPAQAPAQKVNEGQTFFRVVTGSFQDRENAQARLEALKRAGFDSFIDVFKK